MSGWIKLHRKILDNPVVCKDSDHIAVWTYLLLNATHKEYPAMFSGKKIILQPGQLITGRKSIADKFKISESKVQRILKLFENEQQIEQQNGNKNRLVTILSWLDYQDSEHQDEQLVNNKRTTSEQQVNTNKNVKNVKNEINISSTTTDETSFQALGDAYTDIFGTFSMNGGMSQLFMDLRKDGYPEKFCIELLYEAAETCNSKTPSIRYIQSIRDRWITDGINSRAEAKENRAKRGGNVAEFKGRIRSGRDSKESPYAFLDKNSKRTGTEPDLFDPTII